MNIYPALIQFTSALSIALNERDAYTRLHSDRVTGLCIELGKKIDLHSRELSLLETAAALHDIGKLGIPDEVLLKAGRLDEHELTIMQTHSERGGNIVLSLGHDGAAEVAAAIRHHHENFDGQGYPDKLQGENIPLLARIITIADNYDAMVSRRIYQLAKNHHTVIDLMSSESGFKHDPVLLAEFIRLIETSQYKAL